MCFILFIIVIFSVDVWAIWEYKEQTAFCIGSIRNATFYRQIRDNSVFYLTTVYLHLYVGLYFAELIYRLELIVEIVLGCVILSDSEAREKH